MCLSSSATHACQRKNTAAPTTTFTLSVDLAPTILSAVGLATPEAMQGEDIAPLYLADEKPEWRKRVFLRAPLHQR